MDIREELKRFLDVMNKECQSNNEGKWDYHYFNYDQDGACYRYSGCMMSCAMCDSCEKNVVKYIEKCKPFITKMNIVNSIEGLEKIRAGLLVKAEEISKVINVMRAQL